MTWALERDWMPAGPVQKLFSSCWPSKNVTIKICKTISFCGFFVWSLAFRKNVVSECLIQMQTGFQWGNLKARDHLQNYGMDETIIWTWTFKK
jgi:hypothetical protein